MIELVYVPNARTEGSSSNRLCGLAEDYSRITMSDFQDFYQYASLDALESGLRKLNEGGFHLVGSRGFCYHSGNMADLVAVVRKSGMVFPVNFFTRAGGLRQRVIELLEES
jgi:hypothetical protein